MSLATADKPESQEICFVPTGDYRDLLRRRLGPVHPALQPGTLVDRSGTVLGEHDGYAGFTVGQRKGLGGGFGEARFVLEIRPGTREVVVGTRQELFARHVEVRELNWHAPEPEPGARLRVQLRYRAPDVPAVVRATGARVALELLDEVAAVTPGQSAVFYDGDRVLGGGRISASAP